MAGLRRRIARRESQPDAGWSAPLTAAELQRALERKLEDYFGVRRKIVALDRRPSPYTSSFGLEAVEIRFADSTSMRLVMKDLSRRGMLEHARRARPEFLHDPQRETNTYRWILPAAPPGTAAWYGTVTNRSADRDWLLLEEVEGEPLSQVGSLSMWKRTAAWVAQLHQVFPPARAERLAIRSRLLRYDEEFYWEWLHRAQQFCSRNVRKRRMIDRVARHYSRVVERLTGMRRTIIHGELYAGNVVVARNGPRVRICPVDWETTALGPGLVDLATLTAGWDEKHQQLLARAYFGAQTRMESGVTGLLSHGARGVDIDFDCCRLHSAVRMVGWSEDWSAPPEHARDWLSEAVQIAERLSR